MSRRRCPQSSIAVRAWLAAIALLTPLPGAAMADGGAAERLAALIAALGDDDYQRREAAASELKAMGPAAIDALLAAAETSGDLEIALRARWLVDAIPFEMPHDPPEVAKLLARFKRRDFADRVQAMHRLLRVDDDGGIEALARIVRLDPSTAGSRVAAALLAREWRADDPAWPNVRQRIAAGLGPSSRPAARLLAALVTFTGSADAPVRTAALADADTALADLRLITPDTVIRSGDTDDRVVVEQTSEIFERFHIRLMAAAGRRDQAVKDASTLVATASADDDAATGAVEALAWAVEAGFPEAVDPLLSARRELIEQPLVGMAIAAAERARGRESAATQRFAAALAADAEASYAERLQAAMLLVKWGCTAWAVQAYDTLLATPDLPASEAALAAIMYSEFLHDLERDDEAASCLERLFAEGADGSRRPRGALLEAVGRDPRATRSRMLFFKSCALARRGDAAGCRTRLEEALAAYPKDVDALIALYHLPDNTPDQRADAATRIRAALAQLDDEIQAVPDDANGYNEYAWLVANTEGDVEKATRYAKLSLVKSFDNPSYLDTLAHCHAAAGRRDAAIRAQRLAQRQEPHNLTIRRNLERFERLAP